MSYRNFILCSALQIILQIDVAATLPEPCISGEQPPKKGFFKPSENNMALVGALIMNTTALNSKHCSQMCIQKIGKCRSFNYGPFNVCELNSLPCEVHLVDRSIANLTSREGFQCFNFETDNQANYKWLCNKTSGQYIIRGNSQNCHNVSVQVKVDSIWVNIDIYESTYPITTSNGPSSKWNFYREYVISEANITVMGEKELDIISDFSFLNLAIEKDVRLRLDADSTFNPSYILVRSLDTLEQQKMLMGGVSSDFIIWRSLYDAPYVRCSCQICAASNYSCSNRGYFPIKMSDSIRATPNVILEKLFIQTDRSPRKSFIWDGVHYGVRMKLANCDP